MDTKEVGEKLVSLCSKGKFMDAVDSLYGKDIVSVEAQGGPEMPAEMKGIDKIRGKNKWWSENHDVHSMKIDGPYPHNDRFAVRFHLEVTPKTGAAKGKRINMDEVGIYTVKNGKIVKEEFFYAG
jgi:SnoaL-like protein